MLVSNEKRSSRIRFTIIPCDAQRHSLKCQYQLFNLFQADASSSRFLGRDKRKSRVEEKRLWATSYKDKKLILQIIKNKQSERINFQEVLPGWVPCRLCEF